MWGIVEECGTPVSKLAESQFFGTGTSSACVEARFLGGFLISRKPE